MKIAIVTDAWFPQINGVVTTLFNTKLELEKLGHEILTVTPDGFKTIPCPTYPEIRLSIAPGTKVEHMLQSFNPDAVHIATEGPLGLAARSCCISEKFPFTTSLSGIRQSALSYSLALHLHFSTLVSRCRPTYDGRYSTSCR